MITTNIRDQIKAAHSETVRLEEACQQAYGSGDTERGKAIEAECNAASKRYYDLCDQNPHLAPRQRES